MKIIGYIVLLLLIFINKVIANEHETLRILATPFSEKKIDYILTNKDFAQNNSTIDNFKNANIKINDFLKKSTQHINGKLFELISPTMYQGLKKNNNGIPQNLTVWDDDIKLIEIKFVTVKDNVYVECRFNVNCRMSGIHVIKVIFYLNGNIARLEPHVD